eukprot:1404345-Pyramimonas_sp.AAC.1
MHDQISISRLFSATETSVWIQPGVKLAHGTLGFSGREFGQLHMEYRHRTAWDKAQRDEEIGGRSTRMRT